MASLSHALLNVFSPIRRGSPPVTGFQLHIWLRVLRRFGNPPLAEALAPRPRPACGSPRRVARAGEECASGQAAGSGRRLAGDPPAAARRGGRLGGLCPGPAACGGARSSPAGASPSREPQARRGRRASRGRHRPQRQAMRIPPGGGFRGRFGQRAEAASEGALSPISRRAGISPFDGDDSCHRFAGPMALERTRGRVALPLLRRRSGGAPIPPGGGLGAASARAGRSGEGERARSPIPRRAAFSSVGGGH